MTRRILKFRLTPAPITLIETADTPRFLAVGTQGSPEIDPLRTPPRYDVVVWCEAAVGTGVRTELAALMTGEAPPDDGEYIGTTQLGDLVVHVYRRIREVLR